MTDFDPLEARLRTAYRAIADQVAVRDDDFTMVRSPSSRKPKADRRFRAGLLAAAVVALLATGAFLVPRHPLRTVPTSTHSERLPNGGSPLNNRHLIWPNGHPPWGQPGSRYVSQALFEEVYGVVTVTIGNRVGFVQISDIAGLDRHKRLDAVPIRNLSPRDLPAGSAIGAYTNAGNFDLDEAADRGYKIREHPGPNQGPVTSAAPTTVGSTP